MRFDAVSYRLRGLVSLGGGYVQAFGLACHRYEAVAWYDSWVPDSRGSARKVCSLVSRQSQLCEP